MTPSPNSLRQHRQRLQVMANLRSGTLKRFEVPAEMTSHFRVPPKFGSFKRNWSRFNHESASANYCWINQFYTSFEGAPEARVFSMGLKDIVFFLFEKLVFQSFQLACSGMLRIKDYFFDGTGMGAVLECKRAVQTHCANANALTKKQSMRIKKPACHRIPDGRSDFSQWFPFWPNKSHFIENDSG